MIMFKSYLYAFSSANGVAPLSSWRRPCEAPTWRPSDQRHEVVRLGPDRHPDEMSEDERGALLVARGCNAGTLEAAEHGFSVLDLHPLAGSAARVGDCNVGERPTYHDTPDDHAMLVGRALAAAWRVNPRLVAVGPDWALDVLAAIPGAVVFSPADPRYPDATGECAAHGRRWRTARHGVCPLSVAARLSGLAAAEHPRTRSAYGSILFAADEGRPTDANRRLGWCLDEEAGLWRVRSADLGWVEVQVRCERRWGEPVVRWPSSADPWLVTAVDAVMVPEVDAAPPT